MGQLFVTQASAGVKPGPDLPSEHVGHVFPLDFNPRNSFRAILVDEVHFRLFDLRLERLNFARLLTRVGRP